MTQPGWHRRGVQEVAVRGVALGPVPGIVLGRVQTGGLLRRRRLALAVRTPQGDGWTPLLASPHQVIMTWERWRAVQHAAVAQHAAAAAAPALAGPLPAAPSPLREVATAA
jgi:hypothetical protein